MPPIPSKLQVLPDPALLWTGNNGWILHLSGKIIAIDPDLTNYRRIWKSEITPEALAKALDLVLITHAHEDHFSTDTCLALAKGKCRFLVPESCREKALSLSIPLQRITFVRPGQTLSGEILIECCRAVHGHIKGSVYSGASLSDCGYRITGGGITLYEPGDTLLLEEHLAAPPVDVLFVSPTEHNTAILPSLQLIRSLHPRMILPQHFGTYAEKPSNLFWAHGAVEELQAALPLEDRVRYWIPGRDEIISLAPLLEKEEKP